MFRRIIATLGLMVATAPALADDFGFGFSFDSGPRYYDRGFVDSYAYSTPYITPTYVSGCAPPVYGSTYAPPVVVNPYPPVVYSSYGPTVHRREYYRRTVVAPRPVYSRPVYTAPVYRGGYGGRGGAYYNRGGGWRDGGRSFGGNSHHRRR
ncbi:hypothetical protein RAS1_05940 [Phycisphaerae bacterium RAS1]|nr:hypothetical protein RAS1_05940 [Phycisphaerae bacterium RAS1]